MQTLFGFPGNSSGAYPNGIRYTLAGRIHPRQVLQTGVPKSVARFPIFLIEKFLKRVYNSNICDRSSLLFLSLSRA